MWRKAFFLLIFLSAFCMPKSWTESSFTREESILEYLDQESDILVIAFGGMGQNFAIPRFEFVKILSNFNVNILFVRDIQKAFYQYGIELGGNISKTLVALEEKLRKIDPKRVVIFGNSSGGYAALLFGFLLQSNGFPVAEVHAFSPRINLSEAHKNYPYIEPRFFDLPQLFQASLSPLNCDFHMYYAMDCIEDVNLALRFDYDWIKHHTHQRGGHVLVRLLREEGILYDIIEKAIERVKNTL